MVDRLNRYTRTRPRLRKTMGWIFVVIGFVALLAPIVPGAPLLFIGFELLGFRFIFTEKLKGMFGMRKEPVILEVVEGERAS